jgi:C-terminal processing protease CtpA/Prc
LLFTSYFSLGCGVVLKDPGTVMAGQHRASNTAVFSRAEAVQELDELARLIDRVHPDPYRYHSRDIVDAERRRLTDTMPASLSQTELCLRLSRLLASLDDGHSSMSCDSLVLQEWQKAAKASPPETQKVRMFQPATRLDDQNHLIVRWPAYAPGIEAGDRVLRVNGQDVDTLLAAWARETSHDTEAGRLATVARRFRAQLDLHGIKAPYQVTVAAPGGPNREVTVQGDPVNYQFQERPAPPPPPPNTQTLPPATPVAKPVEVRTPFFNYRMMRPGVAYMDFFSLIGDDLLSTQSSFKTSVDAMFRQVAIDKPRVLIIDVRENGGGEDTIAAELYRHFTEKPFRLLSSARVKRSREVREAGKSILRIPFRWMGLPLLVGDGRAYFLGEEGTLSRPQQRPVLTRPRAEPFFDGPVCVLTGPHTYSAGVEFADAAKAFGLATIVGEPTGGQPNSFGNPFTFRLSRSGLVVQMATSTAVRASADVTDFKPVMPDIPVRTTAADIQKYFDPVLERAVSCPAREVSRAK